MVSLFVSLQTNIKRFPSVKTAARTLRFVSFKGPPTMVFFVRFLFETPPKKMGDPHKPWLALRSSWQVWCRSRRHLGPSPRCGAMAQLSPGAMSGRAGTAARCRTGLREVGAPKMGWFPSKSLKKSSSQITNTSKAQVLKVARDGHCPNRTGFLIKRIVSTS